jgi:hypothetical protein
VEEEEEEDPFVSIYEPARSFLTGILGQEVTGWNSFEFS